MTVLEEILDERQSEYGEFEDNANIAFALQKTLVHTNNYPSLPPYQSRAIDMMMFKLARLLTGNNNHLDTWRDLAGYATIVANIIESKSTADT